MPTDSRPRRPFGVTLALLGGLLLFTIIPLSMIALILYLANTIQVDPSGGMAGLTFGDLEIGGLVPAAAAALLYFGLTVWAWRGKPGAVRFIFPLITAVYGIVTGGLLTMPATPLSGGQGIDSGTAMTQTAGQVYLWAIILMTIYMAWFMNRWSARAFYRGYYTKHDLQLLREVQAGSAPVTQG